MSTKIGIPALENFKLFYEEVINIKPRRNRLRRFDRFDKLTASRLKAARLRQITALSSN